MAQSFLDYHAKLSRTLSETETDTIELLVERLRDVWASGRQLFLCGNGGSASNATHLATDFLYGIDRKSGMGIKAHALSANAAIMTCLANDEGYDTVFAKQLSVYSNEGDVLIALSGSGNSPNILSVLECAKSIGVETFAILGFDGGKAKQLADHAIHFELDDMQISEDLQCMVLHYAMQRLNLDRAD
jgi:D-sedoheptulose 7-phosphate isomerase